MKYQIVSKRTSKYSYKINCPSDAYEALNQYHRKTKEHFLVLTLDGSLNVIRAIIITIGILNRTILPWKVFIPAIKDNAFSIVIAHSHPSGILQPIRVMWRKIVKLISKFFILNPEIIINNSLFELNQSSYL